MRNLGYIIALLFGFFAALPAIAFAATINLSSANSYAAGDMVVVDVTVSSDASINAVGATVNFSPGTLELQSISKAGSIISLWAEDPQFNQAAGTASFQGIVPNPGWSGSAGRVVELVFRASKAGQANLSVSDGQVLANDGQGTNVLSAAPTPKNITITEPAQQPTKPSAPGGTTKPTQPSAPQQPAATSTATTSVPATVSTSTPATVSSGGGGLMYLLGAVIGMLFFILGYLTGRSTRPHRRHSTVRARR